MMKNAIAALDADTTLRRGQLDSVKRAKEGQAAALEQLDEALRATPEELEMLRHAKQRRAEAQEWLKKFEGLKEEQDHVGQGS